MKGELLLMRISLYPMYNGSMHAVMNHLIQC